MKESSSIIRVKRAISGTSQADLSKNSKVSQTLISLIELGKRNPSPAVAERIAKALGCPVEKVFTIRPKDGGGPK